MIVDNRIMSHKRAGHDNDIVPDRQIRPQDCAFSDKTIIADHNIGWRTRHALGLDYVPKGVSGDSKRPDNIVYDITLQAGQQEGVSASGWGHPQCSAEASTVAADLPATRQP